MNSPHIESWNRGGCPQRGMTLVELIGALAIVAVLAGVALPAALRILDRLAANREVATLSAMGDGFRTSILRSRQIPISTDWLSVIATAAGMDPGAVTQNPRRISRAFVYDPGGWLASGLPYAQTNGSPPGLATPPNNARIMIVSSLGAPLPAGLNNTSLAASDFANLWNIADDTVPASGPFATWPGKPDDVKIQRVNLAPLFVNVVLGTYLGTNLGLYKVDNSSAFYSAPTNSGVARYFLKGTVLDLYASAPSLTNQLSVVLDHDTSYVYENGVWRSSIVGGVAMGIGDASGIVEAFLKAPENMKAANTNGAGIQQYIIVTNFIAYMSNYNRWEDGNFTDGTLQALLKSMQPQMINVVQGLYLNSGGANDHSPMNNYLPCVPIINP
jgi:prepilin-type N-terminal cleavage/methylation domain-containing protein